MCGFGNTKLLEGSSFEVQTKKIACRSEQGFKFPAENECSGKTLMEGKLNVLLKFTRKKEFE